MTVLRGRPRYPFGRRFHHGAAGLILVVVGALLMIDDARDFPWAPTRRWS